MAEPSQVFLELANHHKLQLPGLNFYASGEPAVGSPAAPLAHYLSTRFRALALFGRRSPVRVVRSSSPAAENHWRHFGLRICAQLGRRLGSVFGGELPIKAQGIWYRDTSTAYHRLCPTF